MRLLLVHSFLFLFLLSFSSAILVDNPNLPLVKTREVTDTNAETLCADNEFLRGDGTCVTITAGDESDPLWSANFTLYNSSWSSITNTSYYTIDNPFGFWNDTFATFNKTYADTLYCTIDEPLWTANFTLYNSSWSTSVNVFDQWLNTTDNPTFNNLTISGNQTIAGNLNVSGDLNADVWQLIADVTITDAEEPAEEIFVDGINSTKDEMFMIISNWVNENGATATYGIRLNSDANTNYAHAGIFTINGVSYGYKVESRTSLPFGSAFTQGSSFQRGTLYLRGGNVRNLEYTSASRTNAYEVNATGTVGAIYNITGTEINNITFMCDVDDCFGGNSTLKIFKIMKK